jgi:uncharacterized peroxidase-related enzyme
MTFIETIAPEEASGAVAAIYEKDRASFGRLPNMTQAFSLRPEVYAAWQQLNGAVKAGMDLRRYELATLAAARRLRSSYCMLAHGSILLKQFLEPEELRAAATEPESAGLDATDLAIMRFAEQVVDDAGSITQADVDELRAHGLSDADVFDVVLAATVRCFYSKTLDALGVQPDADYNELDPQLREVLVVGRPIADG